MAYTYKVTEVSVTIIVVILLAVALAPQWTEALEMPAMDAVCAVAIPEIVTHCYATFDVSPSEECCNDLKTASKTEVTCLCDHFITKPSKANITRALYDQISTSCDVLDKFSCKGGDAKGGDDKGGDDKAGDDKGGATSKIAASTSLFGLVASLILLNH